jgi:anaerobic magnesium-protoporphyrin IX monomethyl ester cyclase
MHFIFADMSTQGFGPEVLTPILNQKGHKVSIINKPINTKYNTHILESHDQEMMDYVDAIIQLEPDVVGFSVMTHNFSWLAEAARLLKAKLNVPIIFGGVHVTSCPDFVISKYEYIDYIIPGEADVALPLFCDYIEGKIPIESIPNLRYMKNGEIKRNSMDGYIKELSVLPMPDKSIYHEMNPNLQEYYMTQASRGCHLSCSFCGNNALQKLYLDENRHVRSSPVDRVIEEIRIYGKKAKFILFVDDVFTLNKDWVIEFTDKYKKAFPNLPYSILTHVDLLNEDILDRLADSKCFFIAIGVQTAGDEEYKKKVLLRNENNEKLLKIVKMAQDRGIHIGCDHIFGMPLDKEEYQIKSFKFYMDLKPSVINLNYYNYFPGTDLVTTAKNIGMIDDQDVEKINGGEYFKDLKSFGILYYDKEKFNNSKKLAFLMNIAILFSPLFDIFFKWVADKRLYRFFPANSVLNDFIFLANVLIKKRQKNFYRIIRVMMGYLVNDFFGKKHYIITRKPKVSTKQEQPTNLEFNSERIQQKNQISAA